MTKQRRLWQFGAALGAWLNTQIQGAANKEAQGEGEPEPEMVERMADQIREEIATAAGMALDDVLAVENGSREVSRPEAESIAGVLNGHGVEATADEILSLSETDEDQEPPGEEELARARRKAQEPSMANTERVAQLEREVADLKEQLATKAQELEAATSELSELKRETDAQAPLVAAGEAHVQERKKTLLRKVALQRGGEDKVSAAYRKRVEEASLADVELLYETLPTDDLSRPACASCGAEAVEYRSSAEPRDGESPRTRVQRPTDARPTTDDVYDASFEYQREQAKSGRQVAREDAIRETNRLAHADIFRLADAARKGA